MGYWISQIHRMMDKADGSIELHKEGLNQLTNEWINKSTLTLSHDQFLTLFPENVIFITLHYVKCFIKCPARLVFPADQMLFCKKNRDEKPLAYFQCGSFGSGRHSLLPALFIL